MRRCYSAATIARGRQLAALGDCAVCHTATNGAVNAGGRPIETPFGTIYSTNITPDPETGIGAGPIPPSSARCARASIATAGIFIRRFPTRISPRPPTPTCRRSTPILMAQAPVRAENRATALAFPFNWRPLMAGWNALFHRAEPFQADPTKSEIWNRGAYLVEGLGHCGACHSPRNALGAEKESAYLAGGLAEGWEAPPLTSLSHAPIPWSEDELFAYLRTGESRFHGVAAGPMAPVVKELAALPDQDIRAMAVYLGSFNETRVSKPAQQALAAELETSTGTPARLGLAGRRRLYRGRLRGLPCGRRPAFVRQPAVAGAEQQSAQRHAGQSDPGHPARHRLPGIQRPRLHAGLQGQPDRRPGRRAGVVSPAAIRPATSRPGPGWKRPSAGPGTMPR